MVADYCTIAMRSGSSTEAGAFGQPSRARYCAVGWGLAFLRVKVFVCVGLGGRGGPDRVGRLCWGIGMLLGGGWLGGRVGLALIVSSVAGRPAREWRGRGRVLLVWQ